MTDTTENTESKDQDLNPPVEQEPVAPDFGQTPPRDALELHGRERVVINYSEINEFNVVDALQAAIPYFNVNSFQIDYLWRYYKGIQPILTREKDVRPEINNKVVENHAQEIVAFKIGYQLAEPLQYTARMQSKESDGEEDYDDILSQVNELNTLMFAEDKASCDRDLFEWMCVCGIGFRAILADDAEDVEDGSAPFEIYTPDPRRTCVVESSSFKNKKLMAFWVGVDESNGKELIYNVYTKDHYFEIRGNQIVRSLPHSYGNIPIVEYRLNNARMGVFEPVLPLLDAINNIESNRLDDIEQTVQALLKFINCDIDPETFQAMRELGAVKVKTVDPSLKADIDTIDTNLDQTGTQTTKDDLYQAIVNICGMPNRNGQGGSTSDTGAAVLLRDGWTLAESHAKSYELQIKRAERDFLRVVLKICKDSSDSEVKNLRIRDIELAFNRRNYENILVKSQVLTTMLSTKQIHPQLAFQACGLFTDPDAAYTQSQVYVEEQADQLPPLTQGEDNALAFDEAEKIGSQAGVPEPGDNAQ